MMWYKQPVSKSYYIYSNPHSPPLRQAVLLASRSLSPTPLRWPLRPGGPALSPGPGTPVRSPDPLGVHPPLGYGAWGDVMFIFLCQLVVGDVSVIHPAAASYAGDVLRPVLCADVSRVLRAP
jgi:hypothetical protein